MYVYVYVYTYHVFRRQCTLELHYTTLALYIIQLLNTVYVLSISVLINYDRLQAHQSVQCTYIHTTDRPIN